MSQSAASSKVPRSSATNGRCMIWAIAPHPIMPTRMGLELDSGIGSKAPVGGRIATRRAPEVRSSVHSSNLLGGQQLEIDELSHHARRDAQAVLLVDFVNLRARPRPASPCYRS